MKVGDLRSWIEDVPDDTKVSVRYYDSEHGWTRIAADYIESADDGGMRIVISEG